MLGTTASMLVLTLRGSTAERSDVVVVLAGERERASYARTLVKAGVAPRLLTTLIDPTCSRPGQATRPCASGVRSTVDEALLMRRVLEAQGVRRATVVTSGYHVRRATAVFRAVFIGSGIDVTVLPAAGSHPTLALRLREAWKTLPSVGAALVGRLCGCIYTPPSLQSR
jgi:uncharacterized SAM-binding protein YcdF (DUF218 family)